jgi:septum formation protein
MLPAAHQGPLVLASGSPRRAEILRMLGFEFEIEVAGVDETGRAGTSPEAYVTELALHKAEAGARRRGRGTIVGADTIVVIDGDILNKPETEAEALVMLRRLRGRWHDVHTGVAVLDAGSGRRRAGAERTAVLFRDWDDGFLRRYVATGECTDKAGAYAIQGLGALLVREIRGCFYNVMGFPIHTFVDLLAQVRSGEDERAG